MGGTKRKQTLESWKEGKLSTWCLTIDNREAHRQLLKRARQVEMQLEQQVSKRQKLESQAKCLKLEVKSLKSIQVKLATTIIRLKAGRSENHRGFSSKSWQSYSRQHQAVKKRRLASDIQSPLSFCEAECFNPTSISLVNKDTGNQEVLDLTTGSFSTAPHAETMESVDKLKSGLYVKDKF